MKLETEMLQVLRHDLHKIYAVEALPHKDALQEKIAQKADGFAAWFSRNFLKAKYENKHYRKSLIFSMLDSKKNRTLINTQKRKAASPFKESDSLKLHSAILKSNLLNLYSEARQFPYTSLKYHILLTTALYYNLMNKHELKNLYLCENLPVESQFQILYKDDIREWSILPLRQQDGLSKMYPQFHKTWDRRRKLSLGGDYRIFDELLSTISSWSAALATIEDFFTLIES